MLQIFLCDDCPADLQKYKNQLGNLSYRHKMPIQLTCFESDAALRFALEDCCCMPDIIYLDVLLGKENGIDTGLFLRKYGCNSILIYLTDSPDYAIPAFRSKPFYYLLKEDAESDLFEEVFLNAVEEVKKGRRDSLSIKEEGCYHLIQLKNIIYLEVYGHTTLVHTPDRVYRCRLPLSEAQDMLAFYPFIRVHRSYLVNPSYLSQITAKKVLLSTGDCIPLGKQYAHSVKMIMSQFLLSL